MKTIMVQVRLPAVNRRWDVNVPVQLTTTQATELIASALSRLSEGVYKADKDSMLIYQDSGLPVERNLCIGQTALKNGSKLLLI